MYCVCYYDSPLGEISIITKENAVCGVYLESQRFRFAGSAQLCETPAGAAAKRWLDAYFAGENPPADSLKLAPEGSEFQRLVCDLMLEIPYGQVVTYGDLAKKIALGRDGKMSAQAVGGAVGHNPISIIIPCHRVIGAGGNLTGYGGGLKNKIWLLEHEGVDMSGMYVPKKGSAL